MLIIHATRFHIESVGQSKRPNGITALKSPLALGNYESSLVVFSCIEKTDTARHADNAVRAITKLEIKITELLGENEYPIDCLVVVPFAHLSKRLMLDSHISLGLLQRICAGLTDALPLKKVFLGDFGYFNAWGLEAYSHEYSTVYREI